MPADSVSIRIYSGIARFPCDSMAFLFNVILFVNAVENLEDCGGKVAKDICLESVARENLAR